MESTIRIQSYDSPCGTMFLGTFEDALCLCDWVNPTSKTAIESALYQKWNAPIRFEPCEVLRQAALQLDEYFRGERSVFTLPLRMAGTDFQQRVWSALTAIPYAQTCSYGELAARIGNPKAARAVGMANNANPISIFVPCHRVIGADGTLTGYGGGVEKKLFLLRLEAENYDKYDT